jgi:hypothetical protein
MKCNPLSLWCGMVNRAESDTELVTVVFRVWQGENQNGSVIALFPYVDEGNGLCSSYMHVGQHSAASYAHCISRSRPATPEEYGPLKRELESEPYGYKLRVRGRRQ